MRGRDRRQQSNSDGAVPCRDAEGKGDVGLVVCPVLVCNRKSWPGEAVEEVRGHKDLDAVFIGVDAVLGVGARDEDAAVEEGDGFGVVHSRDGGVGHDGHAAVNGLGGVVEHGVQVGGVGEAETGHAVLRAVDDEVCSVGEGRHAGHDALGGHALDGPDGVGGVGVGGHAVVQRVGGALC